MESLLLILEICLVVGAFDIDIYENLALNKSATQSTLSSIPNAVASRGNDGDRNNVENMDENSCIHTNFAQSEQHKEAWWTVDLGFISRIQEILITYRDWGIWGSASGSSSGRLVGFSVFVSNTSEFKNGTKCFQQNGSQPDVNITSYPCSAIGRFVTVYNNRTNWPFTYGYSHKAILELCEVEIPGCNFQHYGQHCENTCFCKELTCDYKTGKCADGCKVGYVGDTCNKACDPGYYGEECLSRCLHCGGNKICNQSGVCLDGCEVGFYSDDSNLCSKQCGQCIGIQCNLDGSCLQGCLYGFYMSDCRATCPENCNNGECDQKYGKCTSCKNGYFGEVCDNECPQNCKERKCDYISGKCIACNPGYYGEKCLSRCLHCGGNNICNQSGVCLYGCEVGFYSDDSNQCSKQCGQCIGNQCNLDGSCPQGCLYGFYMSDCRATCPENCNNRECDQKYGKCTSCKNGYFGEVCDNECPQNCKERKCDYISGKCIACEPEHYGVNCTKKCLNCGGDKTCDGSGICLSGCKTGYLSGNLPDCSQKCDTCEEEVTSQSTLPMAVGSAIGGFVIALVIIILVVIFYRRKRRNSPKKRQHVYLHSPEGSGTEHIYTNIQPGNQIVQASLNDESVTFHHGPPVKYEAKSRNDSTPKIVPKPQQTTSEAVVYNNAPEEIIGIRTDAFQNYVILKQKDEEFETEYQSITYGAQYPHVEAEKPENMPKNRFKKTFAYDHSRVVLSSPQGRRTDYINANYIDGYKDKKQYIATQGPTSSTIGDFWSMAWENKVDKIVMVTNLKELNKVKCEQYWPDPNQPIRHDNFEITCLDEREFSYYVVRNLRVENKKCKEQRKVWQFHFTTWPDHGTPDPLLLVLFHRRVMNTKAGLNGPMIVHCSAGIGRTGTFIGLDALFKQGRNTGRVDVKGYVEIMRKDRMNMIQTAQQYECLHEALAEALQTQDTMIMMNEFTAEWRKSQSDTGPTNQRRFRKEYDILVSLKQTDNQEEYKTALLTVNKMKNRNPDIKASDKYRPYLNTYGGERTDYINAVILPTHTKRNGYIVTQRPLSNTVLDFWQMIEEHEISKIVLFEDESDEKIMFYPGARGIDIDDGVLQYSKETDYSDDVTMTELVIIYNDVAEDRKVTVIKVKTRGRQLPNARQILKVNEIVAALKKSEEPCCVISQDGTSPCDIYCTVTNIQESMKIDNEIDVFQTARQLQLRRPEFFGKYENYQLCLRIINEHLTYDSVYFNS